MPAKPKLATVWLGGCSGCHMSFLDLDERLIELAALADLCYSPIADLKHFPEGVDITLVEGAVANTDHLRDIRTVRARTKILIAFGDCAVTGNVTALRNLFALDDVLPRVLRVQDVVPVDHFLPGCPPSAESIYEFVAALLNGQTPSREGRRFGA
jgi:NAD-reducing hydrogenase small subunit